MTEKGPLSDKTIPVAAIRLFLFRCCDTCETIHYLAGRAELFTPEGKPLFANPTPLVNDKALLDWFYKNLPGVTFEQTRRTSDVLTQDPIALLGVIYKHLRDHPDSPLQPIGEVLKTLPPEYNVDFENNVIERTIRMQQEIQDQEDQENAKDTQNN